MANLKEIKNRITSVSSTMQITSAMKMVSAAKLKRAQDAITQLKPYSIKLQEILGNLTASLDLSENEYSQVRDEKNILILAVSSKILNQINFLLHQSFFYIFIIILTYICFIKKFKIKKKLHKFFLLSHRKVLL